ncbi:MAG: glycosyltransferase, partial [Eubacteriales bacterium]|nr:glycosyltransferase [Eubacteriales bacterium]
IWKDLDKADAVYLNWFESIDGNFAGEKFYAPFARFVKRSFQINRAKSKGKRIIFVKHNRVPHNVRYPWLSLGFYKRLLKLSDVIVAFNNDADKDFKEIFPKEDFSSKITVIPPVNYIGVYPENRASKYYELLRPYKDKFIVGFIGKIVPYKNIELIIRAAKELENEDIVFFIAGAVSSDEYKAELIEQVKDRENIIASFEFLPDEEICPVLEICDILLMPYDKVSASNSGAGRLAFSYGRTVISSDISSMNMIPDELIYKYHYEENAEHYDRMMEALKSAYNDWTDDGEIIRKKGEGLLRLMETDYSEEAIREKYKKIFFGN